MPAESSPVPALVWLDAELAGHLVLAIDAHVGRLRSLQACVPVVLSHLATTLREWTQAGTAGQGRTSLDKLAEALQRVPRMAYTYQETADSLGVHVRTVTRAVEAGHLRAVKDAGGPRIAVSEIERYLREGS
ncbi:MAG TPA: helix-turn-helix domain-containing protein [Acidimicrobiales bacterium]|nr:helix-turn-helix domain-containing protein [Acidimicrobiales bacterium]